MLLSGSRAAQPTQTRSTGSPSGSSICFTTRPASGAGKQMLVRRPTGARGAAMARRAPFATLSLALPFASATLAAKKGGSAQGVPKKKKRSAKEVLDAAAKSALRGGLPGMAAMAIQVGAGVGRVEGGTLKCGVVRSVQWWVGEVCAHRGRFGCPRATRTCLLATQHEPGGTLGWLFAASESGHPSAQPAPRAWPATSLVW